MRIEPAGQCRICKELIPPHAKAPYCRKHRLERRNVYYAPGVVINEVP